jgi:hypothetical protein
MLWEAEVTVARGETARENSGSQDAILVKTGRADPHEFRLYQSRLLMIRRNEAVSD